MEMIGRAAHAALSQLTDSPPRSDRSLVAKPKVSTPAADTEIRALEVWANDQPDRIEPATQDQLARHLSFLAATLPSKNVDEDSGKMRVAVYSRILGEFSNHALAFMARKACQTLDWFPTPRQCLEILQQYRPPTSEKDQALSLCHHHWQGRFESFIDALRTGDVDQAIIDAVPLQWRRIAVERGYLRYFAESDDFRLRVPVIAAQEASEEAA